MGCDIHFYVETRQPDGSWKTADTWYDDPDAPGQKSTYNPDPNVKFGDRWEKQFYNGRSYDLFAILADVRNGRGFAGVVTGQGFNPIAEPRGVPEDACEEYRAEVEKWDGDGHSHSYLTLDELFAYDWTQETGHQGYVDPFNWARWRDFGKPEGWSGGVGGGSVRHFTPEAFEEAWVKLRTEREYPEQRNASAHLRPLSSQDHPDLARFVELLGGGSPYCLVTWTEPYYKSVGNFWSETMPRLVGLGKPEDVRLCFFFDN